MNWRSYLITLGAAIFIIGGTLFAIFWARGYRPDLSDGKMKGTGMLVANSFPTGAQVFVNEELITATDNTLNLDPGNYKIRITKDGFLAWEKNLTLEKELVTQTNALLFPLAPDLQALTFTGITDPVPSPDGQKIAYKIASASATTKNGLYVLQMSSNPLSFRANIQQVVSPEIFDLSSSKLIWSPDSNQILAYKSDESGNIINSTLIEAGKLNTFLQDQTFTLPLILDDWEEQARLVMEQRFKKLPVELQPILKQKTASIHWSPDEEKILYTATGSASIPEKLISSLPASSTQTEQRQVAPGNVYVYDTKEDKNFLIASIDLPQQDEKTNLPELLVETPLKRINKLKGLYSPIFNQKTQWFPNSKNLIISQENKIFSKEYDGTNEVVIYAGPMESVYDGYAFVFPWPDASKLVILTTLNNGLPPNLYGIKLK